MRRIDYIAKDTRTLADFLDLVQSDGLQARGCSLYLLLPPGESGSWEDWLEKDLPNEDAADVSAEIDELRRMVDAAALARKDEKGQAGNG